MFCTRVEHLVETTLKRGVNGTSPYATPAQGGAWRRLCSRGLGPRSIRPGSRQIPALPMGRVIGEVVPVPALGRTWLWLDQAILGRMHGVIS